MSADENQILVNNVMQIDENLDSYKHWNKRFWVIFKK